jgi:nicotinate-nucleotide pyrophosphorylase (carboxylating)
MIAYLTDVAIDQFIDQALKEDIGPGDYTTLAAIPENAQSTAQLLIKENGILAGITVAGKIFKAVDAKLDITVFKNDGDSVISGDVVLKISGKAQSILMAERLVLNCMQRMSGIATTTHRLSKIIDPYKARLLDTRKTTPNFRLMEKWAVKIGGGVNHRFALYDMIMIKDNHIDFAGGITAAIEATKRYLQQNNLDLNIEIETRNIDEVKEVISVGGVDQIMLDNMTPEMMKLAVSLIGGKYSVEASGGITEENIESVAASGVDFISVGALTHSVKSLDMSLKASKG